MSLLDMMRSMVESEATAFDSFIRNEYRFEHCIHFFYEGQTDPMFYEHIIRKKTKGEIKIISYNCRNRKGVIKTYENIASRKQKSGNCIMYFIDKDLSDFSGEYNPSDENFFITTWYSIENYLVSSDILELLWELCVNKNGIPLDFSVIKEIFETQIKRFYNILIEFMARAIYYKRNKVEVNFQRVNLKDYFSFDSKLNLNYVDTVVEDLCRDSLMPNISEQERISVDEIIEYLSTKEVKTYVRGKYELWFLNKFYNTFLELLKQELAVEGKKLGLVSTVSESFIVQFIPSKIIYPEDVATFIDRQLAKC